MPLSLRCVRNTRSTLKDCCDDVDSDGFTLLMDWRIQCSLPTKGDVVHKADTESEEEQMMLMVLWNPKKSDAMASASAGSNESPSGHEMNLWIDRREELEGPVQILCK